MIILWGRMSSFRCAHYSLSKKDEIMNIEFINKITGEPAEFTCSDTEELLLNSKGEVVEFVNQYYVGFCCLIKRDDLEARINLRDEVTNACLE